MRYLKYILPVPIILSMDQAALGATPTNLVGDVLAAIPVPVSEILAVLVLGLIGLTVIARR